MNFWERVDELLERSGKNRKSLAAEAGFDASNISKGIKNANVPSADTAVKIARFLDVSVEYLVTGKPYTPSPDFNAAVFFKYGGLIRSMEKLGANTRDAVEQLAEKLASDSSVGNPTQL